MKYEKPILIVIDKAHHALAETYKELWLHYPNAKKLDMTARKKGIVYAISINHAHRCW